MYLQGQCSAALDSITHEVENMWQVVCSDSAPGVGCSSQKAQTTLLCVMAHFVGYYFFFFFSCIV